MLQAECACLYKTVKLVVFYVKNNVNTYPKGRALMGMYRIVRQTKSGNFTSICCIGQVTYRYVALIT